MKHVRYARKASTDSKPSTDIFDPFYFEFQVCFCLFEDGSM